MSPETRKLVEKALASWRETKDGPLNAFQIRLLGDAVAAFLEDAMSEEPPYESKDN